MPSGADHLSRRRFIERTLAVSGAGILPGLSLEEQSLLARAQGDSPGPTHEPTASLPTGKIGPLTITRLICGGNLFSGSAHSRHLIYVSTLLRQYFSPEKIIDTLQLCESNGINAAILRCDEHITGVLERYRKERGGKIQWIAQTYPSEKQPTENIEIAIDHGAVGAFMQGGIGDDFVAKRRMDLMAKVIAFIKQNGLVAGVGSHSLDVPKTVEKEGLNPDFYFKTFNNVAYNTQDPGEVADFMAKVAKPWIAFKVLGAGVLKPRDGFGLAFKMGADFLNVGMFDFQVREDAGIVRSLLAGGLERKRPWRS